MDNEELYKQLQRLKEENEQLKELKDKYYIEKLDREAQLSYCIQALEEIREIAGWHTTNKDSCDVQDDMESIIDIIDEVLKGD